MPRREVERQLRLFGVGDLGPPDNDDEDSGPDISDGDRWEEVYRHLGRLLADEGFERYLAHRERGQDHPGGRQ